MTEPLASLHAETVDDRATLTLVGEVDLSNADELEHEIATMTEGMRRVTIDLSKVTYMDSRGVRIVHQLSRRLTASGAELRVLAPSETFAGGVLRLTALAELEPDDF
jgi:anti-anti-sigma factor